MAVSLTGVVQLQFTNDIMTWLPEDHLLRRTTDRDRRSTYGYQLDAFIAAVEQGESLPTDADDGVKQMRLIDRCYRAAGMRVRGER